MGEVAFIFGTGYGRYTRYLTLHMHYTNIGELQEHRYGLIFQVVWLRLILDGQAIDNYDLLDMSFQAVG